LKAQSGTADLDAPEDRNVVAADRSVAVPVQNVERADLNVAEDHSAVALNVVAVRSVGAVDHDAAAALNAAGLRISGAVDHDAAAALNAAALRISGAVDHDVAVALNVVADLSVEVVVRTAERAAHKYARGDARAAPDEVTDVLFARVAETFQHGRVGPDPRVARAGPGVPLVPGDSFCRFRPAEGSALRCH
jgi:hypothetical protein